MKNFKDFVTEKKVTFVNLNMVFDRKADKNLYTKIEKILDKHQIYFDNDNDDIETYLIHAGFGGDYPEDIPLADKLEKEFKKMGADIEREEFND